MRWLKKANFNKTSALCLGQKARRNTGSFARWKVCAVRGSSDAGFAHDLRAQEIISQISEAICDARPEVAFAAFNS